jgi:hypothetical protein
VGAALSGVVGFEFSFIPQVLLAFGIKAARKLGLSGSLSDADSELRQAEKSIT